MLKPTLDYGFKSYLQSITFFWNHKILWLYMLLPIMAGFTHVYVQNRLYLETNFPQLPLIPEYLNPILPVLGIIIRVLGIALIIIHAFKLMSNQQASISEDVKTLFSQLLSTLIWIAIIILAVYLNRYITNVASSYLEKDQYRGMMITLIATAYSILELGFRAVAVLMLPVLIFEQKSLIERLTRGILLSRKLIWAIIGGYLGIAGVGFVIVMPAIWITSFFLYQLQAPLDILRTLGALIFLVFFVGPCFVFPAKIYYDYRKEISE